MIMWSEGHVTLWMKSSHFKSPSLQVWWSQALWKRRYFVFSLSRDLMWLRSQRVMWHYRGVSYVISDYHVKFGDHRLLGRGDIKLSICCNHITWPRGRRIVRHHGWVLLIISHSPLILGHRFFGIGYIKLLPRDLTGPRSQMVMWNHGLVPLIISHYSVKFCGHRPCRRGDILFFIGCVISTDHEANSLCGIMAGCLSS